MKSYCKYLCGFLEANVFFVNGQLQDCLNKLATPPPQGISTNFSEFFALNAAGCVHLRMNKPSLALLYYNKAIQKSRDLAEESAKEWSKELKRAELTSVASKTNKVLLNCALSHYKQGYYSNAWKLFEKISGDNVNNFLFWYRFGACGLNWFLQECENRSKKVAHDHARKRTSWSSRARTNRNSTTSTKAATRTTTTSSAGTSSRPTSTTRSCRLRFSQSLSGKIGLTLRHLYNCLVLLEKRKNQQEEVQSIKKRMEQAMLSEEEKLLRAAEPNFQKHAAAHDDKLSDYLISAYSNIVRAPDPVLHQLASQAATQSGVLRHKGA